MALPQLQRKPQAPPQNGLPTPPKRRPRRRAPLVIGALVLATIGFFALRARNREVPHDDVKTTLVKRAQVRELVSATGVLQPFTTVDVKSKAGGKVIKMAVEEGTRVQAGQLICLIDQQDTRTAFNQAQADLDAAKSALRQAQRNAQLQKAALGPQIEQSQAGVQTARARLKQAGQTLNVEGQTSAAQIQQSAASARAARASVEQARQNLELQTRTVANAIADAQSGVKAARARFQRAQTQARNQPALSQSAIDSAGAGLQSAQAGLSSAQQALKLLRDSTQPQETATAKSAALSARSQLEVAQTNLTRQEALLAKGYVAQTVVDDARNSVVAARTALQTAQTRLDTLAAGQNAALSDQTARVEAARSSVLQARAALQSARLNSVQDTLANQDVTAARAALEQATTALATARANSRQIGLRRTEVQSAQAALAQAEAALKNTRAGAGQIGVRQSDVEAARAAVTQADAALSASKTGAIQNQVRAEDVTQAQTRLVRAAVTLADARQNLEQTTVRAPRAGVILQKYVDEGSIIQSGQIGAAGGTSIVQLANVSRLYVDVQVDEADIGRVQNGQKVSITMDAYPDKTLRGTVRKIFPLAETVANVTYVHVQVEVDPRDISAGLRPKMNATCDFVVADEPDALSVPAEAIRDKGNQAFVTVILDPKKPAWNAKNQRQQVVKVGVRGDERTEILSGLKSGETIVAKAKETKKAKASGGFGG